jgi:drug/metabolite transporter (DMT)-like permease
MPAGLLLGLFSSLVWGFTDLTAAMASRRIGSLRVVAGASATSLALIGIVIAVDPSRLGPSAVEGLLAGLPLGIAAAVAYLSFFTALRIGPISVISPVVAAYGGVTVVLAVVFRGETLQPLQAAGAACATTGVVLTGLVFHGSLRGARIVGPGVLVAIVTLLLFAILTIALAGPIKAHGWLPVTLGSRLTNTLTATVLLTLALRARSPRLAPLLQPSRGWSRRAILLVAIAGTLDFAGLVAYAIGLEVSFAWLVGLASSFGPVIAVVYAVGRLGERLRSTQWLGLALIVTGLVVLAVAS